MVIQFKLCTSYCALLLMYFEEANLAGTNKADRFTHVDESTKATVCLNTVFNSLNSPQSIPKLQVDNTQIQTSGFNIVTQTTQTNLYSR